jgi:apolipoprotein D and lipocalin family protein
VTTRWLAALLALAALAPLAASAAQVAAAASAPSTAPASPAPLQSLPSLDVASYMGTWYQVAWFPNRFQAQCASDTTAQYRLQPGGTVEVINRCLGADGRPDEAVGQARPTGRLDGGRLEPAQLEVSFLPAALRWLPVGWGRYWVIQLADDGRYAVVSEPGREFLWVLARRPVLSGADETAIRLKLAEQGFTGLDRLQPHRHGVPAR